jgi:hypothetical protein
MDTTTLIIVGIVALLVGLYLFNRSRIPPQGTYDDKNYRSGGSIGGQQSSYDSPDVRSGGSIGGQQSTVDSPDYRSSGTIGGNRPVTSNRPTASPPPPVTDSRRSVSQEPLNRERDRPSYNSAEHRSSGSIGGAATPNLDDNEDNDPERPTKPPRR